MSCPYGCRPEDGLVDDATAMRWMITSLQIGGHLDAPAVRELLELILTGQVAAKLLSRFLREDRTVIRQVYKRMILLLTWPLGRGSGQPSHPQVRRPRKVLRHRRGR